MSWRRKATACQIGKQRRSRHRFESHDSKGDHYHERCVHCGATRRIAVRSVDTHVSGFQYWATT